VLAMWTEFLQSATLHYFSHNQSRSLNWTHISSCPYCISNSILMVIFDLDSNEPAQYKLMDIFTHTSRELPIFYSHMNFTSHVWLIQSGSTPVRMHGHYENLLKAI